MSPAPPAGIATDLKAEGAFKNWVRKVVTGAAELRAFEAGEVDAVIDPDTGGAIFLPAALASRIAEVALPDARNRLLAALPARDYGRLLDGLAPVTLTYGDILYEPGERMRHVYFPSNSLVSLLTVVDGHHALEVGLVGCEGMLGTRLALGIGASPVRALVQGTGSAMRMTAARFLRELQRSPALRQAVLRFTDSLMTQITRTAGCNRFHRIEARLARWLLMTRERLPSNEFHLTQEFLADMLGVRRVGVTAAASALRRRKLIHYRRGDITILDQKALEAASCSCYRHVRIVAG